jgi:hypothetical protein
MNSMHPQHDCPPFIARSLQPHGYQGFSVLVRVHSFEKSTELWTVNLWYIALFWHQYPNSETCNSELEKELYKLEVKVGFDLPFGS